MKQFLVIQQNYDDVYTEIMSSEKTKQLIPVEAWAKQTQESPHWGKAWSREQRFDELSKYVKVWQDRYNKVADFVNDAEIGDVLNEPRIIIRIKDKNEENSNNSVKQKKLL